MRRKMRTIRIVAVVLVLLALGSVALRADTLVLTNQYNLIPFRGGVDGGGSLKGATLNGAALPWLYCVQINVYVYVPGTYDQTISDVTGKIWNSDSHPTEAQAAKIAWLLTHYADGADVDQQIALQAAIWHVEGFGDLTGGNSNEQALYDTMVNNVHDGDSSLIHNFDWLTPGRGGINEYQGLVTRVPDGGMTLMLLGGALVGLETLRRRLSA